jgi:putative endonuclease
MLPKMKIKEFFQKLTSKEKGKKAEELALEYLISKGFEILEKNYKTSFGEIDIIAKKKNILVFVEVKSEFGEDEFLAEEKVDFRKREKILKVAEYFLLKNFQKLSKIKEIRFDVIVLRTRKGEIIHYESAFYKERDFTRY